MAPIYQRPISRAISSQVQPAEGSVSSSTERLRASEIPSSESTKTLERESSKAKAKAALCVSGSSNALFWISSSLMGIVYLCAPASQFKEYGTYGTEQTSNADLFNREWARIIQDFPVRRLASISGSIRSAVFFENR
jgi:hypothetical protein